MVFSITLGSTVKAKVGFVVQNETTGKKKRSFFTATVIQTLPNETWRVFWHDIQKSGDHKRTVLQHVKKVPICTSKERLLLFSHKKYYIGDHKALMNYTKI